MIKKIAIVMIISCIYIYTLVTETNMGNYFKTYFCHYIMYHSFDIMVIYFSNVLYN